MTGYYDIEDHLIILTTDNGQAEVQAVGSWGGSTLTVTTSHESGGVHTATDEGFQIFVVC
ncbi:MAG: hypothetical protein ACRDPI_01715 [Nocardioidaceae bacterium]